MAERTILVDDINGSLDNVTRTTFSLDGEYFEIDLDAENAARLREILAPYVEKGRVQPYIPAFRRKKFAKPRDALNRQGLTPDDRAAVRSWARANGFDIPDRGRIAQEMVDLWKDAQEAGGH